VLDTLFEMAGDQLPAALADSALTFAIGLVISLVAGLSLGVAMGLSRLVRAFATTYVELLMTIPPVAFIPLLLLWFGTDRPSGVVIVVTFTLPGLIVNTERAIRTVDPARVEMARSFGVDGLRLLRLVLIPSGMPLILAGIRIAAARAVKGAITGEMLIAVAGIGGELKLYGDRLDGPRVYALVLSILVMAIVLTEGVRLAERNLLRWQER
jgi:NitT/TauT family transport system permease protein